MQSKMKHLEMIQGIINRMGSNSFSLKGWAVTLVAGIFALAAKDTDKMYFLIVYIPVIVFWGLDAYYLKQERLYRSLYSKVAKTQEDKIDFSMDTSLEEFKTDRNTWISCLFSPTQVCFYLPLALICGLVIIITFMI